MVILALSLSCSCSQVVSQSLAWGCRIHFQGWVSSQHGSWFPPEQVIWKGKKEASVPFRTRLSEVAYHHVCLTQFTRSESPNPAYTQRSRIISTSQIKEYQKSCGDILNPPHLSNKWFFKPASPSSYFTASLLLSVSSLSVSPPLPVRIIIA